AQTRAMTAFSSETRHPTGPADRFAPFADRTLAGRIALVAGATRGAGRAIARDLARAGAFVHCTGRSTAERPSDYGRDETIEGTASLVTGEAAKPNPTSATTSTPSRSRRWSAASKPPTVDSTSSSTTSG